MIAQLLPVIAQLLPVVAQLRHVGRIEHMGWWEWVGARDEVMVAKV